MALNPFIKELKKPINTFNTLLAVAGILSSLLTYYWSNKTKSVSYLNDKPLLVKDSLYSAHGYIWNSGELTIPWEDVRTGMIIYVSGAKEIVSYRIVSRTYPDVAGFKLLKLDQKAVKFSWKYFDPGYGLEYQILYDGKKDAEVYLAGEVLDLKDYNRFNNIHSFGAKLSTNAEIARGSVVVFGLITLGLIFALMITRTSEQMKKKERFFRAEMCIHLLTFAGACGYFGIMVHQLNILNTIPFK